MLTFNQIRLQLNKQKPETKFEGRLLSLDPGETTGCCLFCADQDEAILAYANQIKTWPLEVGVLNLAKLIEELKPAKIVFESYQVYEWKADDHSWSQIPTVQIIGCIKTLCIQLNIPYTTQTAQVAKGFCSDAKLKEWGFYQIGLKHARDAIRHGCYYLLFGNKKEP